MLQVSFISADPNPFHKPDPGSKKSLEIHLQTPKFQEYHIYFKKLLFWLIIHMNNKLIIKTKKYNEYYIFVVENVSDPDPLVHETDPRIKMKRIHNTNAS